MKIRIEDICYDNNLIDDSLCNSHCSLIETQPSLFLMKFLWDDFKNVFVFLVCERALGLSLEGDIN